MNKEENKKDFYDYVKERHEEDRKHIKEEELTKEQLKEGIEMWKDLFEWEQKKADMYEKKYEKLKEEKCNHSFEVVGACSNYSVGEFVCVLYCKKCGKIITEYSY